MKPIRITKDFEKNTELGDVAVVGYADTCEFSKTHISQVGEEVLHYEAKGTNVIYGRIVWWTKKSLIMNWSDAPDTRTIWFILVPRNTIEFIIPVLRYKDLLKLTNLDMVCSLEMEEE